MPKFPPPFDVNRDHGSHDEQIFGGRPLLAALATPAARANGGYTDADGFRHTPA